MTQVVAPPFGTSEATARRLLLDTLANGGFPSDRTAIVHTVRRAYDKMPAAARAGDDRGIRLGEVLRQVAGIRDGMGHHPRGAQLQTAVARPRKVVPAGLTTFLIESDGTAKVWCIGGSGVSGWYAGVDHDDRLPLSTAFVIPGLTDIVDMAAGSYGAYALLSSGRVMSWGSNARGGLGNTPRSQVEVLASAGGNSNRPTPVLDIADAIGIAAGSHHAHALTRGGEVYSWGYNLYSQLGIGEPPVIDFKTHTPAPMAYVPFPMKIPGLVGVAQVAAGEQPSLALMKDGTVRAWGTNKYGEVGDGTTITRLSPVAVAGIRNAVAVVARSGNSAALLADGTVMVWGHGNSVLGRKTFTRDGPHPTPARVEGVTGIKALAIGSVALALTASGSVISWGDQVLGELGHNGPAPAPVRLLSGVQSVAAYTSQSFAVLPDNRILTWGGVPVWARVDGSDHGVARLPIPLVVKNLHNPFPPVVRGGD